MQTAASPSRAELYDFAPAAPCRYYLQREGREKFKREEAARMYTQVRDVSPDLGIRFTAPLPACAFCIMQQEIATLTWKVHSPRRWPTHPPATRSSPFCFANRRFVSRLVAPMRFRPFSPLSFSFFVFRRVDFGG